MYMVNESSNNEESEEKEKPSLTPDYKILTPLTVVKSTKFTPYKTGLQIKEEEQLEKKEIKRRKRIFYLISTGNATGQSFMFNFFSNFAVLVGVGSTLLGFITSIRNLMSSLFQGSIGRLSDKYGRRYFLLTGFFLVFSSLVMVLFVNNIPMLIIVSILQALSLSIIVPVWNAALGDVTEMEDRASYIGRLTALGTILSVALMLILATIFQLIDNVYNGWIILGWKVGIREEIKYDIAFGLAAFNFLLCILGSFLLRETRIVKEKRKQPKMLLALKNPCFRKFFIINSTFGLIMATMWPIFPIAQVTVLNMSFAEIAIIQAVFSSCSSLAQYFGGKLGDKIGRKPLIIFGRLAMFTIPVVMIVAVLANNWLYLLISNFIGGAGMGAVTVSMNAYILDLAPDDQMGAYTGLNQVGWGISTFIGSLSAGFIADAVETAIGTEMMVVYVFTAIAALRLLAGFGFFFISESLPKDSREKLKAKRETKLESIYTYEYTFDDSHTRTK